MRLITKLVVALGATLATTAAFAQSANHFRGTMCIYATNNQCAALGWSIGQCAPARFAPPNYNGGPNATRLSVFWGFYAQSFIYPNGAMVGTGWKNVVRTDIGSGTGQEPAQMRILAQSPANPSASNFINIHLDIAKFEENCLVKARFSGTARPVAPSIAAVDEPSGLSNGAAALIAD